MPQSWSDDEERVRDTSVLLEPKGITTTILKGGTAILDMPTGTATLVTGAEVVRSVAVSYATPILSQVFIHSVSEDQDVSKGSAHRPDTPHTLEDELTPLTWLQDSNLLQGTVLSPIKAKLALEGRTCPAALPAENEAEQFKREPETKVQAESPTSDYGEEFGDPPLEVCLRESAATPYIPHAVPYNPLVHIHTKPPYSFSCLIFMAVESSQKKALPVKDIYSWIIEHFPYFRTAPPGWKNSVRHNLSLNKCFKKVDKELNIGSKGSFWTVDPKYRPNLQQALRKTPFHSYSSTDRIHMVTSKTMAGERQENADFADLDDNFVCASPHHFRTVSPSPLSPPDSPPSSGLGLAAGNILSEDVDAAAVMLSLKHGTPVQAHKEELMQKLFEAQKDEERKRKRKRATVEDHSYSSSDSNASRTPFVPPKISLLSHRAPPTPKGHRKTATNSPTSSIDEAFSDTSCESDMSDSKSEIRQMIDGADALLNLANVAASLAVKESLCKITQKSSPKRKKTRKELMYTDSYKR